MPCPPPLILVANIPAPIDPIFAHAWIGEERKNALRTLTMCCLALLIELTFEVLIIPDADKYRPLE